MPTNIAIVIYSLYGHITSLAEEIQSGLEAAGCDTLLCRAPELLSDEILDEMDALSQDETIPICTIKDLAEADGIIFGISARFGMASAQLKSLWDSTGQLWAEGALVGKTAGIFVSTGTQGGGQETVPLSWLTQLTHHGMIYVPSGYTDQSLFNMDEVRAATPYGPGTFAGFEGDRELSDIEKTIAKNHGNYFAVITTALKIGREIVKSEFVEEEQEDEMIPQIVEAVVLNQAIQNIAEEPSIEKETHIPDVNEITHEETKESVSVEMEEEKIEEDEGEDEEGEEVNEPEPSPVKVHEEVEVPVKEAEKAVPIQEDTETKGVEDNPTETNTANSNGCCLLM